MTSWRTDPTALVLGVVVFGGYAWAWRRSSLPLARLVLVGGGCVVWLISGCSFIGVYGSVLFWVRALQFVLILMVAPLLMALGRPFTAAGWVPSGRVARVLAHPAVTSAALLVTPWLIYLTAWYPTLLADATVDALTRILLVTIGFGYFYARLQVDPVPRRYPQVSSLLITVVEALGDGVLGVVLWQGAIVAASYYEALHRDWGPSIRTDQTIGAGVFWIFGDVVGIPFLMVLLGRFRAEERGREAEVDAALDRTEPAEAEQDEPPDTGLWWEHDPRLRDRYR